MELLQTDQSPSVIVIGGSGRVGKAVLEALKGSSSIVTVGRYSLADQGRFEDELLAVIDSGSLVLNMAGVAHLGRRPTPAELDALVAANVALPLTIARICLERNTHLVHVSSAKAAFTGANADPYSWSKRACDTALCESFGAEYLGAKLSLAIMRPPALLIPPFDAGKLRMLRFLAHINRAVIPPIALPVLSKDRFIGRVKTTVCEMLTEATRRPGASIINWHRSDCDSLADIADAMKADRNEARNE